MNSTSTTPAALKEGMRPKPTRDSVLALLALVLALAAAYGLDYAIFRLRASASQTFDNRTLLWAPPAAQLLLAVGLAGLVWWLMTRAALPRAMALVYVAAGLTAVLSVPITFATPINLFPFIAFATGTVTLWTVTGSVLTMAGIWRLFHRSAKAD